MKPSYDELLQRVAQLERENRELRIRCGLSQRSQQPTEMVKLSPEEKVALFRGLFRGRSDVFARRWYSPTSGKSGYQPVCANELARYLCDKRKYKCANCPNRKFEPLTYQHIYNHLAGKDANCCDVIGLYAILADGTCYFLCADFDDKSCEHGYVDDVKAFVAVCDEWHIPVAIERSRSGSGAHVWIFFAEAIPASTARRLGYAVLNEAMNRSGRISFKSYDRFIPNQDRLPDGGFGNLIALPLQGMARRSGNSVFVNRDFEAFHDQWAYLKSVQQMTSAVVDDVIRQHYSQMELSKTGEESPWELPKRVVMGKADLPRQVVLVRVNRLYVPSKGISAKMICYMRRMASFHNPEFYSKQAMRFSTHATPRIISCAELSDDYVALPRGCEDAIVDMLRDHGVDCAIEDKTNPGTPIDVKFRGELHSVQVDAVAKLSAHHNGILSATTAFGKTVAAIGLIAKLKVNTLILVHTRALQDQWIEKLNQFLEISYAEPEQTKRRGRRKNFSPFGSGKDLHNLVDVVTFQSCIHDNTVNELVRNYGLVIVDECHHVSAVSFEQVLNSIQARCVYGLTATPIRKDGLQPIIFMQCGPIRYSFNSKDQISEQTFQRYLISRFTSYRCLLNENPSYAAIMQDIADDETRNQQIVDDVKAAVSAGRTPIVITTLRSHVTQLATLLSPHISHVIELVGAASATAKRMAMTQLSEVPDGEPLVIVATGKYVGEGFDYPRLDTLFLAMPISWKGTIAQYAGRLHRSHQGKLDVQIFDYVDIHNPICEKMYRRRLKGYASIGYKAHDPTSSETQSEDVGSIFDGKNFEPHFLQSLNAAKKSVAICAPQICISGNNRVVQTLSELAKRGISVTIFTQTQTTMTEYLLRLGANIRIVPVQLYCAVIDKSETWYGSINYLGYNSVGQNAIALTDNTVAASILAVAAE